MMNELLMSAAIDAISIAAARAQKFNTRTYVSRDGTKMMRYVWTACRGTAQPDIQFGGDGPAGTPQVPRRPSVAGTQGEQRVLQRVVCRPRTECIAQYPGRQRPKS